MRKYTRQLKYTRSHPTRAPLAHYKTMTQIAHAVPLGNGTPGCEQIQDTSTIHTTCAMVRDAGGAQAGGPQRTEHPNPRRGPNEPRRHNTETGARAQRCLCVGHASVTWTSLWSHGLRVRAPSRARRFLPTRSHYTPRVGARLDHIKYQPREQLGSSAAPPDWAPSHHTAPPVEGGAIDRGGAAYGHSGPPSCPTDDGRISCYACPNARSEHAHASPVSFARVLHHHHLCSRAVAACCAILAAAAPGRLGPARFQSLLPPRPTVDARRHRRLHISPPHPPGSPEWHVLRSLRLSTATGRAFPPSRPRHLVLS